MLPIVPLQRCLKLLQPLGTIMCVYWFDSQVMLGVCCVHMAEPLSLADGCPRVLALKQRSFFSPSLYRATELTDSLVSYSVAAS